MRTMHHLNRNLPVVGTAILEGVLSFDASFPDDDHGESGDLVVAQQERQALELQREERGVVGLGKGLPSYGGGGAGALHWGRGRNARGGLRRRGLDDKAYRRCCATARPVHRRGEWHAMTVKFTQLAVVLLLAATTVVVAGLALD